MPLNYMFQYLKTRSKGQENVSRILVSVFLILIFGVILIYFMTDTAKATEGATSCSNPVRKAMSSILSDLTGGKNTLC